MAVIKAENGSQGCGEIGILRPCQWQCEMVQSLWKRVRWVLKK